MLDGEEGESGRLLIAFDVEGTLIDRSGQPRLEVIALLKALSAGNTVIVWSESGGEFAAGWGRRLGLDPYVWAYRSKDRWVPGLSVDIAIDDERLQLAAYNVVIAPGDGAPARPTGVRHEIWL